jgi:hypothetical protein
LAQITPVACRRLTRTSCPSSGECGDELSVDQLVETLLLHAALVLLTVANHATFYACGDWSRADSHVYQPTRGNFGRACRIYRVVYITRDERATMHMFLSPLINPSSTSLGTTATRGTILLKVLLAEYSLYNLDFINPELWHLTRRKSTTGPLWPTSNMAPAAPVPPTEV